MNPSNSFYQARSSMVIFCTSLLVLSSIAVILRFLARYRTKATLGPDDWLVLVALTGFYGCTVTAIWAASTLFNDASVTLTEPAIETTLKVFYAVPPVGILTTMFTKLSILFLYRRIFTTVSFQKWVTVVASTCVLWGVGAFIAAILKCIPLKDAWNPADTGTCYNTGLFVVVSESINLLQDIIIVLMPVGMIRRLQLPLQQKVSLCFIFLTGGFVSVISVIRIKYTWNPQDQSLSILYSDTWFLVQLACAIISTCLPTYRALLPKTFGRRPGASGPQAVDSDERRLVRVGETPYNNTRGREGISLTDISETSVEAGPFVGGKDLKPDAIMVQQTVVLHSLERSWFSDVP